MDPSYKGVYLGDPSERTSTEIAFQFKTKKTNTFRDPIYIKDPMVKQISVEDSFTKFDDKVTVSTTISTASLNNMVQYNGSASLTLFFDLQTN